MLRKEGRFGGEGDDEEEEAGNWLDSYSDLVTDLMAIFVVLFSFAMMMQAATAYENDEIKQQQGGSSSPVVSSSSDMSESSENTETAQYDAETLRALQQDLSAYIDEANLSEYLSVSLQGDNIIVLHVSSSVLFGTGDADITVEARDILNKVALVLEGYSNDIKLIAVEGHADPRPISSSVYSSNWELSSARAANVVEYLLEVSQLRPDQLSAVGYAEFRPIADNETEEGMAQNRRVDFVVEFDPKTN